MLLFPRCAYLAAIAGLALLVAAPLRADDKLPVNRMMNDRQIIDLLAAIHDRGAILYNAGDHAGCYHLFEGSLVTVRPLLPRELQDMIAVGIPDAERQPSMPRRAMLLHELMEAIRVKLRPTAGAPAEKLSLPRSDPHGGKKGGDPDFDSKKKLDEFKKGSSKLEEPPPPIRLPTLGTPTKGLAPGDTAEPKLLIPETGAKSPPTPATRYPGGIEVGAPIEFDMPKIDIKQPPPATKPKDDPKPGTAPPIIIGGGDAPKLDPPPLISPKDVAPTSPAPPSPKPKDDGKPSVPPIVIPLPDGK
jgi:hypothetical protein